MVWLAAVSPPAGGVTLDGMAAQVNEHTITIGDVLIVCGPVVRQLRSAYSGPELQTRLRKAYEDALNTLIERRLILDAYEEQGGSIPEWVVDQRANELVHEMFGDDRGALNDALAADGMTYEEWREEVRNHIIVASMRTAYVDQKVSVAPGDVRRAYEEHLDRYRQAALVDLKMITLKRPASAEGADAKRRQAEELRARAAAGEDFGGLAKKFSEDEKAEESGAWGWIDPGLLRAELVGAIAGLGPGEISGVVETPDDFHIVRIDAKRLAGIRPFGEVQAEIEQTLRQEEALRVYGEWIGRLRERAYVKRFDVDVFE